MNLLGIDFSLTKSGIAEMTNGKIETSTIEPNMPNGAMKRAIWIVDRVQEICKRQRPDVVIMEDYAFGAKGQALTQIHECVGIIKYLFIQNNIKLVLIPPTTLKKFVTGSGRAKKPEMCASIKERWGRHFDEKKENDMADAFALVQLYLRYINKEEWTDEDTSVFSNLKGRF